MSKKHNFSCFFLAKKVKVKTNGKIPVYLRLILDGKRIEISTGRCVYPKQWDDVSNSIISDDIESKSLSKYLDSLKYQVTNLFYEMSIDSDLNVIDLKNAFLGIEKVARNLMIIHKEYNEKVKSLIGIDYRKTTYVRYQTSFKHLENYLNKSFGKSDLPLSKIDHAFVTGYDFYLKKFGNLSHNTAIKYHKNLKKILAHSRANKWISHDPYSEYKLSLKKTDRGYLTDKELHTIINKEFKIERIRAVRDCFVVACFTGLAYSDLERLKKEHLFVQNDGSLWIKINRMKTDIQSSVPVLGIVKEILDHYNNHPACKGKLLPVSSNQKMNSYLKNVADECGIEKDLTTHLARHTFATTVTLNNDVPIETVSKMLGHTSLKTTKIYARLLDNKVARDMSKINDIYKRN